MQATEEIKPFKIVAAVDFSHHSPGVLQRALAIANLTRGSEVHAVAVADDTGSGHAATPEADARLLDVVNAALKTWTNRGFPLQVGRVLTHALVGKPAKEIVWLAAFLDADLIIVGTHGWDGVSRRVLGPVTEDVVRTAGCPVIADRPKHHEKLWATPEIEPPCPECVVQQQDSGGKVLWCARHREHHPHAHVYSWKGIPSTPAEPWGFTS